MSCPSTATVYGATEDVLLGDELAELVPGAAHITDTHSGHNIMIGKAPVVIRAIRMVVDAARAGQTSLKG
jgi:hypothetical protein